MSTEPLSIAIIGTGSVGSAIARGLKGKGHAVTLGSRNPDDAATQTLARATGAAVAPPMQAATNAEIVILALPWGAAGEAVKTLGDLAGKVVIDCMNPLGMVDGTLGLTLGHDTSGGEVVQAWLPEARVVKTLNQVGAEIMTDTVDLAHRPVMFMAADDPIAKEAVGGLLADLGFEALDAGDISKSRLLEPFGLLWINQATVQQKGRRWAFAAVEAQQ